MIYLPPPAQAQAQPAQAQAHAHAQPPPPPPVKPLPLDVRTGGGLVFWVIPSVKLVRLPTTPADMDWTLLTTEAAKSDPGR